MSAHFGLLADVPGSSLRLRLTGEFISSAAAGPPPAAPPPPAGVRQLAVRHSECAATEIDSEPETVWCECCRNVACEEASSTCRRCNTAVRELRLLARRQDACDVFSIAFDQYPELGQFLVREYRFMKEERARARGQRFHFDVRSWLTRQQPADGPSLKRRR